ncbi:MAG: hypothetical protein WBM07_06610, partial [Chitinivibrionales bacterium]
AHPPLRHKELRRGGAEKTEEKRQRPPPKKNEIMVAAGQHILQQRKECHVRFDASVGVHSQSLVHRHVGNPATASVAYVGYNEVVSLNKLNMQSWTKQQ